MPLSLSEIEDIRDECLADDLDIDFERMSLWSADEARVYFESGGEVEPPSQSSTPLPSPDNAPKLPAPSEEQLKSWFPKRQKRDGAPKFRLVCFHNAGSAESIYTGRGMRQSQDNPFVKHCAAAGGELLCPELPGREARRKDARSTSLRPYAEALFPVLAPLLQDGVPYAMVGHSMGTWMLFETLRLLMERGIPLPAQIVVSSFPAADIAPADRPWRKSRGMGEDAFKDECRTWDINEVIFQPSMWKVYEGLLKDDFNLFDEYEYAPLPAPISVPVRAYYAAKDKNVKRHHVDGWKRLLAAGTPFSVDEVGGNHLFFYDVPVRAAWMEAVVRGLPFGS